MNDIAPLLLAVGSLVIALIGAFAFGRNWGIVVERMQRILDNKEYRNELGQRYDRLNESTKQLIEVMHLAVNLLGAVDLPGTVADKMVDSVDNFLEDVTDGKPSTVE